MVLIVAAISFAFSDLLGYRVVALLLLMTVSIIAMLFEIAPVLVAALLSSLVWNFFFIPPIYTFHINSTEDGLLFLLYFVVALVNTVLSFKIRKEEKKARDKEQKLQQIEVYNTLLNSLSHELRTPISTIIGAVDTLRESKEKLSIEQQDELLNQIDVAGVRLNRQVENLLNMSRLESGVFTPKLDWCDSNELIAAVVNDFSATASQKIIFIPNEEIPLLKVDAGLIEQILHNLIHNAVLYTPDSCEIHIQSVYEKEHWKLTVVDNGLGIDLIYFEKVFTKFFRVPQTKTGGSGLGLSIVKGFVEMQGGCVKATNNYPSGLSILVELPTEASYVNNLKHE
jgi:two-component system sensor histidine kinase KdpD